MGRPVGGPRRSPPEGTEGGVARGGPTGTPDGAPEGIPAGGPEGTETGGAGVDTGRPAEIPAGGPPASATPVKKKIRPIATAPVVAAMPHATPRLLVLSFIMGAPFFPPDRLAAPLARGGQRPAAGETIFL